MCFKYLWLFDGFLGVAYDIISQQDKPIQFNPDEYQVISFNDLPDYEQAKYHTKTCNQFDYTKAGFIKIMGFQRYKNCIGDTKIYKFFTPDRLIFNRIRIPNLNKTQYLLLDSAVIATYHHIKKELKQLKLNEHAIEITSGFRNPSYNKIVGGAKCSQHQFGKDIDIYVKDINGDGKEDTKDRLIIYNLLNDKLIKTNGGIGKYSNSPKIIHFDTRGHKARW